MRITEFDLNIKAIISKASLFSNKQIYVVYVF